jgi:hypothetical protein
MEIGFYIQEGFKGEIRANSHEATIDIKIIKNKKIKNLIGKLSDKLFKKRN